MTRRIALAVPLLVLAVIAATDCGDARPSAKANLATDTNQVAAVDSAAAPNQDTVLTGTIDRRIVIYVEGPAPKEPTNIVEAMNDTAGYTFERLENDLLFYRANTSAYMHRHQLPLVRLTGRRPLAFLVGDSVRRYDFANVKLWDFLVVYEPKLEPRIVDPANIEEAVEFLLAPGKALPIPPSRAVEASPPENTPRPGWPYIERNVCEGEGCSLQEECTLATVRFYRSEGDSSQIAFELPAGDTVTALEGHMHHRRVGAVLMLRDAAIRVADQDIKLSKGDTVPLLSYDGEGWYHIWAGGAMQNTESFF